MNGNILDSYIIQLIIFLENIICNLSIYQQIWFTYHWEISLSDQLIVWLVMSDLTALFSKWFHSFLMRSAVFPLHFLSVCTNPSITHSMNMKTYVLPGISSTCTVVHLPKRTSWTFLTMSIHALHQKYHVIIFSNLPFLHSKYMKTDRG